MQTPNPSVQLSGLMSNHDSAILEVSDKRMERLSGQRLRQPDTKG